MYEQSPRTLNYLSLFSFTDAYWQLNEHARGSFHEHWLRGLAAAATNVDIYQNVDSRADILVWCALNAPETSTASEFFGKFAVMTTPFRRLMRAVDSMWGFTDPSPDAKARSPQEIDPLSSTRLQYLMAYPLGGGAEWYRMSREARQAAIDEHIRIGNAREAVKQLTLRSVGLQPYELVQLYESDDLGQFEQLEAELRDTEAGRFGAADRPAYTAIYHPAGETLGLWK